jgi:hypothetical protein
MVTTITRTTTDVVQFMVSTFLRLTSVSVHDRLSTTGIRRDPLHQRIADDDQKADKPAAPAFLRHFIGPDGTRSRFGFRLSESLILSGADDRLVVLRNGVLIGATQVTIAGPLTETTAYSLSRIDAQGFHWMQLPLPGQSWNGTRELPVSERA